MSDTTYRTAADPHLPQRVLIVGGRAAGYVIWATPSKGTFRVSPNLAAMEFTIKLAIEAAESELRRLPDA